MWSAFYGYYLIFGRFILKIQNIQSVENRKSTDIALKFTNTILVQKKGFFKLNFNMCVLNKRNKIDKKYVYLSMLVGP
jgi:hypothetical protein